MRSSKKSEGSTLQPFACGLGSPRQRQSRAAGRSNEVTMNFDAVVLEAIYQLVRERAFVSDRRRFLRQFPLAVHIVNNLVAQSQELTIRP